MKYIVIEMQTNHDGTMGNQVFAYDNRNEAYAKYHTVLAYAAVSSVRTHAAVLMTNQGVPLEHQYFAHAAPEPESEEGESI